jgi:hypothetical protein
MVGALVAFACWGLFVLSARLLLEVAIHVLGRHPHIDVGFGMAVKFYGWVWFPVLALSVANANLSARAGGSNVARATAVAFVGATLAYWSYRGREHPYWMALLAASTVVGLVVPNVIAAAVLKRRSIDG